MRISLKEAAKRLTKGEVIRLSPPKPSTVWQLAIAIPRRLKKIFHLKNRPPQNPLILHVASIEEVKPFTPSLPEHFMELTQAFWPGPLTLVIPIQPDTIPAIARAHLPTQAFRMPMHSLAIELLQRTGPLFAPSANLSGKPSAVTAEHVEEDFGLTVPVLDGGPSQKGVEFHHPDL